MTPDELLRHLESLLFVSPEPAEISQLAAALDVPVAELEPAIDELAERCRWRGIRVQRKGQRVQLASSPDAAPFVERYLGLNAVTRLSQAALETLAIIAYRQPITRPEIEVLRGVDCDGVLRTLTARQLITEVGRLDTVGHPIRYGTTFEFLRYFGLERLDQLPSLNFAEPVAAEARSASGAAQELQPAELEPEERLTDEHQDAPGPEAQDQDANEDRRQISEHAGVESWPAATAAGGTPASISREADAPTLNLAVGGASLAAGLATNSEAVGTTERAGGPEPEAAATIRSADADRAIASEHAEPEPSHAPSGLQPEAASDRAERVSEPPAAAGEARIEGAGSAIAAQSGERQPVRPSAESSPKAGSDPAPAGPEPAAEPTAGISH